MGERQRLSAIGGIVSPSTLLCETNQLTIQNKLCVYVCGGCWGEETKDKQSDLHTSFLHIPRCGVLFVGDAEEKKEGIENLLLVALVVVNVLNVADFTEDESE